MKVLILGGDGYLGWPTAMYFSHRNDTVMVVDNFIKRKWESQTGVHPLVPIITLHQRIQLWRSITNKSIEIAIGDLLDHNFIYKVLEDFGPDTIVHYGEQPSAPYSMATRESAVFTQTNNVIGTLNLLFGIRKFCPDAHLVKLGTMGEYGTPNIDIEEGWLDIEHKGRTDRMLYPKKPGSFYHLSKVHDSNNIEFCCRSWGLRATDLNQGIVYGIDTAQTILHPELNTSFHYDSIFGTVLNRFLVQAAVGAPLTVYGNGEQIRSFLNLRDTLSCVALATDNPAKFGEFGVFNQFTQQFSIQELANLVVATAKRAGITVDIHKIDNPRVEQEKHYFNATQTQLLSLGLKPTILDNSILDNMFKTVYKFKCNVRQNLNKPNIKW